MSKRALDSSGDSQTTVLLVNMEKTVRIDKQAIKERTLKRLMSAGEAYRMSVESTRLEIEKILCEGCHKRAYPAEADSGYCGNLVGECRFCSRRSLCRDCWATCKICRLELCSLCSVKDYSQKDTQTLCLDCYRQRKSR